MRATLPWRLQFPERFARTTTWYGGPPSAPETGHPANWAPDDLMVINDDTRQGDLELLPFAPDSALEGNGFEPSVPPVTGKDTRSRRHFLMHHPPRKAIASTPELANRAPFPLVIESFLMGAPDYTVGHYDREGSMILDEFHNFLANLDVFTNIAMKHMPGAHFFGLCIFGVPAMVPSPSGLQTFTIVRCKPAVACVRRLEWQLEAEGVC